MAAHIVPDQVPWVEGLIGKDQFQDEGWSTEISMCLAECFCVVRMEEIFEIVADYPDSRPAVMELCSVLDETHMQSELASRLEKTLIRRLLHPGANTSQIIDVYINTIKVQSLCKLWPAVLVRPHVFGLGPS